MRVRWNRVLAVVLTVVALVVWPRIWAFSQHIKMPDVVPAIVPGGARPEVLRGILVLGVLLIGVLVVVAEALRHDGPD